MVFRSFLYEIIIIIDCWAFTDYVKVCDLNGLSCLTSYFGEISKERRYCDCLASCEEAEYSTLYSSSNE